MGLTFLSDFLSDYQRKKTYRFDKYIPYKFIMKLLKIGKYNNNTIKLRIQLSATN